MRVNFKLAALMLLALSLSGSLACTGSGGGSSGAGQSPVPAQQQAMDPKACPPGFRPVTSCGVAPAPQGSTAAGSGQQTCETTCVDPNAPSSMPSQGTASSNTTSDRACTMEAKVCKDGTSVGRNMALNCAFDKCPGEK